MDSNSKHGVLYIIERVDWFLYHNRSLFSYVPRFYCCVIAKFVTKTPLLPHKFAHPLRWYTRLLNIEYYGIMLPSSGITLRPKIVIISEFFAFFLVDGFATNWVTAWRLCCPNFPSRLESRIIIYTKMSINRVKNYRPVIYLIIEQFCFSHVKRFAALSLWPKYPV
jgi:hypothetical protein